MEYLTPIHYKIHLEPNLETFIFDGNVEFKFDLTKERKEISLHALELNFKSIEIKSGDLFNDVESFEVDLSDQLVHIKFDEPRAGEHVLRFIYTGEHNDKLAGFYRSKFKLEDGSESHCAVTQFQANDARRAFPCVDIPGKKATFDIEFLMDKELFAISNMPITDELDHGEKKLVQFDRTPKMSTYLLFFGVGNFEFIEKQVNGRQYRTLAHPPKAKKHGQFALDFSVKVVEYCEEYFDFSYPLPKLDQIATPAFAAGAMENWGAILYRENALLYYDGITSKSQENGILGVVAHEISHQWFGNLVSPETWKYLWLNESFATFFSMKVVDNYYPDRKMWDYYVASTNLGRRSRSTSGVMDWDSMINTSPIELAGEGVISFTAKTVPILYSKGGSILRQVETYLGKDGFRDGLRGYFKKHAYGASKSDYLWTALKEETGKPVNKMMETWVLQKGLPLVSVSRDGNKLTLSQKRFTYLHHNSDQIWIVPVSIKLYNEGKLSDERILVLDEPTKTFELPQFDAYKLNTDMTGFFRTKYPEQDYAMLGKLVADQSITAIDRLVLEDELFALLKAKMVNLEDYLEFIESYENENSHLSLLSIAVHLRDIYQLLEGEQKTQISNQASDFLDKVFDNIGYHPKEGEEMGISIIRGTLLTIAVELESQQAKEFALEQFNRLKSGDEINTDIRGAIKAIGAKLTNDMLWFREQFNNPEAEAEFISTILAMTNFSDTSLLEKVLDMVFTEIPSRNRGTAITNLCRNDLIKDKMWEFYLANLDSFEALNNFMYQGAIVSILLTGSDKYDDMNNFFKDYIKKNPNTSDAVDVGLEQLRIQVQLKEHLNS